MAETLLAYLAILYFLVGLWHCCIAWAWALSPIFPGEGPDRLLVTAMGILSIPGWPILHVVAAGAQG